MATYLTRTFGTPTSTKKFTISVWVKRTTITSSQALLQYNGDYFYFNDDTLDFETSIGRIKTNRLFRDPNAWYHLVVTADTTLATADDRFKMYVNGVQETSFASRTNPSQNADFLHFNSANAHKIGQRQASPANDLNFRGILSHYHFCDGYAYDASAFGSTDSTTGEWKINTAPSVTYGNNGFFILKDGNSVTDQSGNSNNFTVGGGTLTNTEDCPSNVFATLNASQRSLSNSNNSGDYLYNGNNTFDTTSASTIKAVVNGTLGVSSGKWYWEYKVIDNARLYVGVGQENIQGFSSPYYDLTTYSTIAMNLNGTISGRNTGSAQDEYASGTSNTTNDIIGIALDMDNKALYIHKNGTYLSNGTAVGVPTSGSSRTGSLIEGLTGSRDDYFPTGEFIFPVVMDVSTSGTAKAEFNFGNGYFGTTAVSSNSGNGYSATGSLGKFQYQPPTGYTALSTKGLNE